MSPSSSFRLHCSDLIADEVVPDDEITGRDVEAFLDDVGGDQEIGLA